MRWTRMTGLPTAAAALLAALACGGNGGGSSTAPTTGTVEGIVRAGSDPVQGASLSLARTGRSTLTRSSGADGSFRFQGVEAGSWSLQISPPSGFVLASTQTNPVSVNVLAGQTATVNVALASSGGGTGAVRVTVREGTTGRVGVSAQATAVGASTPAAVGTTDNTGAVTLGGLAPGSYDVGITIPSGFELQSGVQNPQRVTVTAGATTQVQFQIAATSAGLVTVNASGTSFSPSTVTITVGQSVRWVGQSGGPHTVTPSGHSQWTSTTLNDGQTFTHTFNSAGTFNYFCIPHESLGMTGQVVVQ